MPLPDFASPGELPAPAGYSHVVGLPPGRLVWTSGQRPQAGAAGAFEAVAWLPPA